MKYCVALFVAALLVPVTASAQLSNPKTIFRAQSPMLVQGAPSDTTLTPGYPVPAPANIQPNGLDVGSQWNAFSPPQAPLPPNGLSAPFGMPAQSAPLAGPSLGAPYQTFSPAAPQATQPYQTFQPQLGGQPGFGADPFLTPQQFNNPYQQGMGVTGQGFTLGGANGPEPYRFGWQQRLQLEWVPDQEVSDSPATGEFGWFGLDYELQWTQQMPGWIFITVPQFGLRNWSGPGGIGLSNDVYHFGYELRMETPRNAGPVSYMLSFTPQINTDLERSLTGDGWFLDGKAALFFQLDQYWQLILGVQYWDRVNDQILPYGGLVYTDDFWQWQLTFPEARASLFLGSEYLWAKWLYVRAEYHVEAYQVDARFGGVTRSEQIELKDWRALLGLKMDTGRYDWFIEGGWVFARDVNFKGATPNFDVGTGFIGHLGFRF